MLTRRLALRRETLAALSTEDMAAVAGGAPTMSCVTCLELRCYVVSLDLSLPPYCPIPTFHGAAC